MERKTRSLRFGLMINSLTVDQWQHDTIRLLMDNGMKLSLVIHKNEIPHDISFSEKIKRHTPRHLFYRLWNKFIFKPRSRYSADIDSLTKDVPTIFCTPTLRKGISYFSEMDIQEIRNQNLDFILQLGYNILAGDVINTTKYGIWTFNHGENRDKSYLPGFWEFMNGDHCNTISLQRLSGVEEKEIVLKEIHLKTTLHSYKSHLEQIDFEGATIPLLVCRDLIANGILNETVSKAEIDETQIPNNFNMIGYFTKSVWRRLAFHLNDLFRQEDWNVGYCECDIEHFIDTDDKESLDIKWFKKPRKNCYFADPFVIKTKKDIYIFFEWYSYSTGKADLAVALKSENFEKYHKLTNFKEHRSYPYIFEYENIIYCMPEAHQTKKVTLYRFDEEKIKLEEDCVLLNDFPIVDATLYHNKEKWFMFLVNQKKSHTHLEIYHSDNLKGPYQPHYNNPVMIDCSKARPAGKIFDYKGKTIRPSQNCTEHYGQSITLEEMEILTDKTFKTKHFMTIEPIENCDYDKGIHTINSDGEFTVFDGKRFVFTTSGFKQQLKQKIRK